MKPQIINRIQSTNFNHLKLVLTTAFLNALLVGTAAAQNSGGSGSGGSPSGVVENAIDSIVSEAAAIGSLLLFAYGFYQLINAGMSDEKSGPLKKVAVSWGLGIIVRSWDSFMNFITSNNISDSSTIRGADPVAVELTAQTGEIALTAQTVVIDLTIAAI